MAKNKVQETVKMLEQLRRQEETNKMWEEFKKNIQLKELKE